jgi:hypothetical protein
MGEWKEDMLNRIEIKSRIVNALYKLHKEDKCLFTRNNGRGLSERCIVFRFAHYLQSQINDYFVDCDFNSSFDFNKPVRGKLILNSDGQTATKRFIDIIVHKRTDNNLENLACFEIKKWNNSNKKSINKDLNNLVILTGNCGHKYGFHIILGKTIEKTTFKIYMNGHLSDIQTWGDFHNE